MLALRPHSVAALCAAALSLFALSGCKKYPNCKKDKDCQAGEKCVANLCQNCTEDADCADKTPEGQPTFTCNGGRCGPPGQGAEGAGGGEEGDPCAARTDCLGGLACKQGVCALCDSDTDCSPQTCNLYSGRCSPEGQCETDDQCAIDEICDGGMCIFSGDLGTPTGPCGLDAVFFAFDSAEITPQVRDQITAAAECIQTQNTLVYLEAHADDRGTEEYNILLTEKRGNQVKGLLTDLGVTESNLQVIAKGDLEATGTTESERAKDRRVQFIWSSPPTDQPADAGGDAGDDAGADAGADAGDDSGVDAGGDAG